MWKMGYSIFGGKVLGEIRHKNRAVSSAVGSCLSSAVTCLPTYLPISIYTNARRNVRIDRPIVSKHRRAANPSQRRMTTTVLAHWAKRCFDDVVLKGLYVLSMVQYANYGRLIS